MRIREEAVFEGLFLDDGAPGVGGGEPEHLLGPVLMEPRQGGLGPAPLLNQPAVGAPGLLQTAVVSDVLALCDDAVDLGGAEGGAVRC